MATKESCESEDTGELSGKYFVVLACYKQGINPGDNYRTFVKNCAPQLVHDLAQLQKISREFLSDGNRRKRVALSRESNDESGSEASDPADATSLYDKINAATAESSPREESVGIIAAAAATVAASAPPARHRRRRTEERTQIFVEEDPFGVMDKFNDRENKKRTALRKGLDHSAADYQEKHSHIEMQSRYHWYIASVIGPWQWKWAAERFSAMLIKRSRSLLPRVSLADILATLQETPVEQFVAAHVICGHKVTAYDPLHENAR